MTTPRHPLSPPPMGMSYARLLCHGLSRVTSAPAYVVNQDGHLILVDHEQMREGWYAQEQVVYVADPPVDDPLPDQPGDPYPGVDYEEERAALV